MRCFMSSTATNAAVAGVDLKHMRLFREACYVDGKWVQAAGGGTVGVDNPASGEIIGKVPKLSGAETRHAIEVANEAFKSWSARTAKERANILRKWFDLMMENQEDLARLMTLEQGKPLTESRGEVSYAASFLEWVREEANRGYADGTPGDQARRRIVGCQHRKTGVH